MKVTVVNFPIFKDISKNLQNIKNILESSEENSLVIFPEGAISGYFPEEEFKNIDFKKVNHAIEDIQNYILTKNIFSIIGSLVKEQDEVFNTAVYFSPNHSYKKYRKVNLATLERGFISQGNELPIFTISEKSGDEKFGIQLCREIRFPEQWRVLALKSAKFIVHINNAINGREEYPIWKSHLISRAAELQRYVISVNAASSNQKCPTIIIDPTGKVLCEIQSEKLEKASINIDLSTISNWYLDQSRSDIVALTYESN